MHTLTRIVIHYKTISYVFYTMLSVKKPSETYRHFSIFQTHKRLRNEGKQKLRFSFSVPVPLAVKEGLIRSFVE